MKDRAMICGSNRKIFLVLFFVVFLLAGCVGTSINTPVANMQAVATSTFTPSPTETCTPTAENCFWNWAYGDGSSEFDTASEQKLGERNINAEVNSTSYGEVYSCGNTYSPMCMDVQVEVQVESLVDLAMLTQLAKNVDEILPGVLSVSDIHNICSINLNFIVPADNSKCYWDRQLNQCTL